MKVQQAIETIISYGQECRKAQGQLLSSQKEAVTAALSWFLKTQDKEALSQLAQAGVAMRNRCCGPRLAVRGLVEFSSYCGNTCLYCGLNRGNSQAERYRLTKEEILTCASAICKAQIGTMVLQSGEDGTKAEFLEEVLRSVKAAHPNLAITLSVGERRAEDYSRWKAAGADRFLLRIESSDPELYASLHQGRRVHRHLVPHGPRLRRQPRGPPRQRVHPELEPMPEQEPPRAFPLQHPREHLPSLRHLCSQLPEHLRE